MVNKAKRITGISASVKPPKGTIKLSATGEKFKEYNAELIALIDKSLIKPSEGQELVENAMAFLLALESAKLAVIGAMEASELINKAQVEDIHDIVANYSKTRKQTIELKMSGDTTLKDLRKKKQDLMFI